MYLDTIGEQGRVFLYSCGFGFFLGFIFDVFSFVGIFLPRSKGVIFTLDFIYMILITFLMFIFGLSVHNGSFKFYVYLASAIGWFVWYFSAGAFSRSVSFRVAEGVCTFFRKIKRGILKTAEKIREKRVKKSKKSKFSSNLLLQDDEKVLYNNMTDI